MDATNLPNFAVSSLCAATASCSAASLGYAWATTGERLNTSSNSLAPVYAPSSTPRPSTSLRRSGSRKRAQQRPQSAVVHSSRDSPWALSPPAVSGTRTSHQSHRTDTPVESLQETEENSAEENGFLPDLSSTLPRRSRSTWFRKHRLTLTPSSGQSSTVTDLPPPSSPSLHTNASNTPFIPTSSPVAGSRNRLVKRSTSQSLHGRSSLETYNINNTSTFRPTFRRPATSHQRSVDSRVQALRHQHSQSSSNTPSFKPSQESIDYVSHGNNRRGWQWDPFFRRRIVRVKDFQEPSLKDPSSIFLGKKDELKVIRSANGELPTLVMAASVTARINADNEFVTPAALKRPATQSFSDPAGLSRANRRFSQFREELPETSPAAPMSSRTVGGRFNLPFGNSSSTTSPTPFRVIRRRGSKKQDADPGVDDFAGNGNIARSVSDTQTLAAHRLGQTQVLPQRSINEMPDRSEANFVDKDAAMSHSRRSSDVQRSSPLVARSFEDPRHRANNASKTASFDGLGPRLGTVSGRRHSLSESPIDEKKGLGSDPLSAANLSSANARYIRGYRVVSDHGSFLGAGSDTDHSRVFSVNGDDTDGFSETNYDSLRTGGTNSSSSGIRPTRIEHVFMDQGRETAFSGDVLSVLEEKLSNASLSSSSRLAGLDSSSVGNGADGRASLKGASFAASNASPRQQSTGRLTTSQAGESPDFNFSNSSSPRLSLAGHFQRSTNRALFSEEDLDSFWDAPETSSEIHRQDEDSPVLNSSSLHLNSLPSGGFSSPSPLELQDQNNYRNSNVSSSSQTSKQAKIDLWTYSEHNPANVTPHARPQTVHGKTSDGAGHRAVQRRVNHQRSHSEPKVADDTKPYTAEMFQLGKRGASENWDNDFEDQFQDPMESMAVAFEKTVLEETRVLDEEQERYEAARAEGADHDAAVASASRHRPQSSSTLSIPRYITKLQGTVRGQFKAVGELRMQVEELRRLIAHAEKLNIKVTDRAKALREEALGIIQLADADEANAAEASQAWKTPKQVPGAEILGTSPSPPHPQPPAATDSGEAAAGGASGTSDTEDAASPFFFRRLSFAEQEAADRPAEVSPPKSMAEAIVKNMAAANPSPSVGTKKTNFDTMALKELVGRASACVSGLKMEIAEAEGTSPQGQSDAVKALQDAFVWEYGS